MYALIDGNNFYVSCERVFRADLRGHPVVVLSNNDGCAISRSDEARALGIKMGQPYFEFRALAQAQGVTALSANFGLYGDISNRMMSILAALGPAQEIYSIDECFVGLQGVTGNLLHRARHIRQRVLRWIDIPCCVGLGATKTLAKLANHVAKTAERKPGRYAAEFARICHLGSLPASDLDAVLAATPVQEVWGIGRRMSRQLQGLGVHTALDAAHLSPAWVRQRWGVTLERTIRELQGQSCVSLEDGPQPRQHIAYTRSFGQPMTALADLREAVSTFATHAATKLRADNSHAAQVLVFIHTSPHRQGPRHAPSLCVPLVRPCADTRAIVGAALTGLTAMYRTGHAYIKAGVMLLDLRPARLAQGELGADLPALAQACAPDRLMAVMDALNQRYGQGTVMPASSGMAQQRAWGMKQAWLSPPYTTSWKHLPVAMA